jgi:hypothetical protein
MEPKKKLKVFDNFKTKKKPSGVDFYGFSSQAVYRYLMEFPLYGVMYECWVNCELPAARMDYNPMNLRATHQWQPIQVKIRELFGGDENKLEFYNKLRSWFLDSNKINTTISRINITGEIINRWDLRGCFVSNVYYGNTIDYGEEPELEITLHYDHCNFH